ncbi:MAG: hypothetical protein OEO83_09320 [Alphaproteobacteria bacterium]|nr:hypothetical protein [Alphaproteobacteria bacterium]
MNARPTIAEYLLWAGASLCVVLATIFGLMQGNMDSVRLADVIRPLAVLAPLAVGLTLALIFLAPALGRILPVALFLFFSFHGIRGALGQFAIGHALAYGAILLGPLVFYLLLRRIDRKRGAFYVFVTSAVMALTTFIVIAPSLFYAAPPVIDEGFRDRSLAAVAARRGSPGDLPDIIYVVPDRYPSADTLRREFGVDNSAFYAALRKRGFAVAENARSNYPKTFQSMASTLNSGYLQNFTTSYGADSRDKRPVYEAVENNVVQDRLRKLGYRFHNYGNWWEPTRINRFAAVNYQGYPPDSIDNLSEFERALLNKTPALNIIRLFTDAEDKRECRRIRRKFRRLEEVGNGAEPVFVFAHMLVPHSPIVMDAEGRCLARPIIYSRDKTATWPEFKAAYVAYLRYFNRTILRVVDRQLARREQSGRQLLFVIQADEGPFPKTMREAFYDYDLTALSGREISMKTGIINALRLPSGTGAKISAPLTPVNNWRIIFNALTGAELPMLPHAVYIYPTENKLYRFCEVTALSAEDEAPPKTCAN